MVGSFWQSSFTSYTGKQSVMSEGLLETNASVSSLSAPLKNVRAIELSILVTQGEGG